MEKAGLHAGHRERLRRRFRSEGLDSFERHNALELILFYAIPRRDTNELAHRLLKTFGSLSEVLDAPYESLLEVDGVNENTATLLKLIPAAARLYLTDRQTEKQQLNTPAAIGAYLQSYFVGLTRERICLLLLDSSLKPITCRTLAEGSVESVSVDSRLIVENVLRYNACAVVLAHNHPRGIALPSSADISMTMGIKAALNAVNVRLVDHIIVAGDNYLSLVQFGAL